MVGIKGQRKGMKKEYVSVFEDKDGYLCLKFRTKTKDYIYKLHRLIKEYDIKRKLKNNEVVHHKNGDKQDNRLKNLEVKKRGKHQREHQIERGKNSDKQKCKCGNKKSYGSFGCMKCRDKNKKLGGI